MDKCKKNLSSTAPNRLSAVPKPFSPDLYQRTSLEKANGEELSENDGNFHQGISPNSQKPKKWIKNFMGPTISAASKSSLPRKKILIERNEAFGSTFAETQMEKSTKIGDEDPSGENGPDLKFSSQITPSSLRVSESGYSSDPASPSLPYDPLTNYLSPRPQFLRYKPNRRLETLLHRERKMKKGEKGLVLEGCSSIKSEKLIDDETPIHSYASLQGGTEKQDGSNPCIDNLHSKLPDNQKSEENEEEDDDDIDDEEREEGLWHYNMVLKFLFLLGILFFATFYISSANRPAVPPCLQSLQGFREGYSKFQEPLFLFTKNSRLGVEKFSKTIGRFSNTCSRLVAGVFFPYLQLAPTQGERGLSVPFILTNRGNENNGELLFLDDSTEGVDLEESESYYGTRSMVPEEETVMETDDDLYEAGEKEEAGSSSCIEPEQANEGSLMNIIGTTTDEEVVGEEGMVKTTEIFYQMCDVSELQSRESNESLQIHPTQFIVNSFPHENAHCISETELVLGKEEIAEDGILKDIEITDRMYDISEQGRETSDISEPQLVLGSFALNIPSTSETELNSGKEQISLLESLKDKFNFRAAIGFSLISVLAACTVFGCLHLKRRRAYVNESSSPNCQQQPSKPTDLEKSSSSFPEKAEVLEKGDSYAFPEKDQVLKKGDSPFLEKEQVFEKGDSYANSSSLVHSNDNYSEFFSTHPPTVELLGEYALGEISFPKKSSDRLSNAGAEERKFSQSQEKKRSPMKSFSTFSTHIQPSPLEYSTAESPSYGSFVNTREKLMRKEESSVREEAMKKEVVTTPVRRSSRIRSRVISP